MRWQIPMPKDSPPKGKSYLRIAIKSPGNGHMEYLGTVDETFALDYFLGLLADGKHAFKPDDDFNCHVCGEGPRDERHR